MPEARNTLIVQIPCLNEEETLPQTLAALPAEVPGIDRIEILVVNDGSTDRTVEVARAHGVHHVLDFRTNQGLGRAMAQGLMEAARLGAAYLVNVDADNQYNAADIPKLIAPLLSGEADIVVGERPVNQIEHFSPVKKLLQRLGSWVVRNLSGAPVRDTPSGFRAYNRKAMLRLFLFNDYTYTQESLIAARDVGLRVIGVPIRVNGKVLRPSRLMKSTAGYILSSAGTILRYYILYHPRPLFFGTGAVLGLPGFLLMGRFLYYYFAAGGQGHIQSLIVGSVLLTASMLAILLGVITDALRINRRLLQETLAQVRTMLLSQPAPAGHSAHPEPQSTAALMAVLTPVEHNYPQPKP